jgi:hypothetical protein
MGGPGVRPDLQRIAATIPLSAPSSFGRPELRAVSAGQPLPWRVVGNAKGTFWRSDQPSDVVPGTRQSGADGSPRRIPPRRTYTPGLIVSERGPSQAHGRDAWSNARGRDTPPLTGILTDP